MTQCSQSIQLENFVRVCQTYRHRFFECGVFFQVLALTELRHPTVRFRHFPKILIMDPAPTAPLPAAGKWVGLTVHGSDVLGGANRHAPGASTWLGETGRRSRQGCQRLATQSKPHDKPLVDSFEAEKNSNLPLQRDGLAAADAPSNSPPKPYAPGYRLS